MAWSSAVADRIAGSYLCDHVTRDDLLPELGLTADAGWIVVEDAVLLKSWYESYFGDRARFSHLMDYEIAVNGRGVPSYELSGDGDERIAQLLRRGVAFARAALCMQFRQLPDREVGGYVSAAPTLFDPNLFTANVTFCTQRAGDPPYINPDRLGDDIVVALFTNDCHEPLPG